MRPASPPGGVSPLRSSLWTGEGLYFRERREVFFGGPSSKELVVLEYAASRAGLEKTPLKASTLSESRFVGEFGFSRSGFSRSVRRALTGPVLFSASVAGENDHGRLACGGRNGGGLGRCSRREGDYSARRKVALSSPAAGDRRGVSIFPSGKKNVPVRPALF